MATIQIFGIKNSQPTRAAERFFKERRAAIHMVDLRLKPMSAGELKRFVDRFGWAGLVDVEGHAYAEAGLKYLKISDSELLQRIEREPKLLRLPLVRAGNALTVGPDEAGWKTMLTPAPPSPAGSSGKPSSRNS
jgi:arsenate reductase (glutaredoxin)